MVHWVIKNNIVSGSKTIQDNKQKDSSRIRFQGKFIVLVLVICTKIMLDFMSSSLLFQSSGQSREHGIVSSSSSWVQIDHPEEVSYDEWVLFCHRRYNNNNNNADMKIIVLTMNRFQSLERLLNSLRNANYTDHDRLDLIIKFDHPSPNKASLSSILEWKTTVQSFRQSINWEYGDIHVVVARENLGLRESWFQAWIPSNDHERAVIFEDDLEVSPLWYQWLKSMHDMYGNRTDLAGFVLMHQYTIALKSVFKKRKNLDNVITSFDEPFLYRLFGTHGYSPVARVWKEFIDFIQCWKQQLQQPDQNEDTVDFFITPELIVSDWYLQKPKSLQEQHYIYFTKQKQLYHLFQYPKTKALTVHWEEKGEHFDGASSKGPRIYQLIRDESDFTLNKFPAKLKKYGWGAKREDNDHPVPTVVMSVPTANTTTLDGFARFVGNLRSVYSGDVWLLISTSHQRDAIRSYLTEQWVQWVETDNVDAVESRWSFYASICEMNKYLFCMTADFEDTIFQSDPFTGIGSFRPLVIKKARKGKSILYVYEHTYVMDPWEYLLKRNMHTNPPSYLYYKEHESVLKDQPMIDGGNFIATPTMFLQLKEELMKPGNINYDPDLVWNLMIRSGSLMKNNPSTFVQIHPQGAGAINVFHPNSTLGGKRKFLMDSQKRYLNQNCMVSPVVHQHDIFLP